ncbi:sigma-54-dependent Fis family transcriptional regulator [Agarivorans sp. MS3-6]|uniref:sigma-54-dependent Fis family transcriptional regulator n=1 Tax=Agarivorans sp. TSD2052 TaxID=2937286 RepID=UPI00200C56A5|nr:sigma-54-dependent Fis family transcriptional regulator [Agarivorans sp. TSD2052]UPW17802.1 sigma-54-dependent Fis family transcriptional regulator [Agarivorans sp. TSD2052]
MMSEKSQWYLEHEALIKHSWQRCRESGLTHHSEPELEHKSVGDLSCLLEQHHQLLETTHHQVLPYYENLLANSNSQVMLADHQGYVLKSWGEQRFKQQHHEIFSPGTGWQEPVLGTNAIGTAIKTGSVVQIHHDEHFLVANRFMTGSAAPIYGVDREMVGVIDISSDTYLPESHTLGMVKIMSQAVENQLIISHFNNEHFLLRFNTSPENIDSQWSALIVFDETGLVISANRRAELVLATDLKLVNISELFDVSVGQLINQPESFQVPLLTRQQFRVHGILHKPKQAKPRVLDFRTLLNSNSTAKPQHRSEKQSFLLDDLSLGDPVMAKAVAQSKRIVDKDIPILIRGETGVGKEVFVKALHQSSQRSKQNMVTVNCAAIPQELVESELFGYEKGAFTGSSSKGYIGLIRKADKGTLFLDEIGDMPLNVQARLLRVLQERRVNPLGSTESYPVDFKLVSATNRNLKDDVEAGSFRQDLYYRVSGLNIELPALRHRSDRQHLIQFLLNYYAESPQDALITERAMHSFCQHPWPGNIRQLVSVIQIAQAMSDNQAIDLPHLPDDFFADLASKATNVEAFTPSVAPLNNEADTHKTATNDDIVALYQSLSCNISKTAQQLGVSRNTVYKRLRESGYK